MAKARRKPAATDQCHDITVFPAARLAAGACSGNGIIFDISDPRKPTRIDAVTDTTFSYWHSATFNNDGTKVLFTDEWGGGGRPRCRVQDPRDWGADAIYDIVDGKLQFRSHYKLPAAQTEQENCVAHNGSIIPVPGRDIFLQAWYQGGMSVIDFTDSSKPFEIAYFDRGPIDAKEMVLGGLVGLLVPRSHLRDGDHARAGRPRPQPQPISDAKRDCCSGDGRQGGTSIRSSSGRCAGRLTRWWPSLISTSWSVAAR